MSKFRAFLWTSILGGGLLISSGSALADSSHGRHEVSNHNPGPKLVRAFDNERGKLIRTVRRGPNDLHSKGYYVQRNGRYYWVNGYRSLPDRYWKRYQRRSTWGHGHVPRTVIIEREVGVERDTPSIQIGPEELSIIIPLPW